MPKAPPQRVYRGEVENGLASVWVHRANRPAYELCPQWDIANHSPTGFRWGYHGAGPAQLALALLCDAIGRDFAREHYQAFKVDVVATFIQDASWQLTSDDIQLWAILHGWHRIRLMTPKPA